MKTILSLVVPIPTLALVLSGCQPEVIGIPKSESGVRLVGMSQTPATAEQVLAGLDFWDGTGAKVAGTMANNGAPSWTPGTASQTLTAGYYSGGTIAGDASLVAANLCSTATIFGVTGTTICESGTTSSPAGAANILSGLEAWDSTGAKITGSMSSRGALDASASFPGSGFYNGTVNNVPGAAQICSGTSVLGTTGTASCGGVGVTLNSNVHRDQATTAITQTAETTTYAGAALPAGYRDIPDITTDDSGYVSAGVTSPQVTLVNRASFVNCGTTQTTIAARLSDCAIQNGANATWEGAVQGNAGQGVWKLVTRAAASKEVWQDQRTGLLWSSVVTTADNWCRAAGNGQTTGNGYAANDPNGTCNSMTYQPNYVNNSTAFSVQSVCVESGPVTLVPSATISETWGATPTYSQAKGGMGLTATASSPSVRWRLPTKYDYQQADNNGIRFVMPEMAKTGSGYEWSASVVASDRSSAWMFHGAEGVVSDNSRYYGSGTARCVGR
jgi:hypothetical protein